MHRFPLILLAFLVGCAATPPAPSASSLRLRSGPAGQAPQAQPRATLATADPKGINSWVPRAPIGRIDWSQTANRSEANPRGYNHFHAGLDARQPGYPAAFRANAEPYYLAALDLAVEFGCKIVYEHDLEGSEVAAATYRGHPLTESPPEQSLDFLRWRVNEAAKRGLWWGCTVRHTHYRADAGKHVSLAPPELTLAWEMAALRRLGPNVRFVYLDTNLKNAPDWGPKGPDPLPASVYARAAEVTGFDKPETRFVIAAEFGVASCPAEFKKWGATDATWGDIAYYSEPGVAPWRYVWNPASTLDMALSKRGGFDVVVPGDKDVFDAATLARLTKEFRIGHVPVVSVVWRGAPFNAPILKAWAAAKQ